MALTAEQFMSKYDAMQEAERTWATNNPNATLAQHSAQRQEWLKDLYTERLNTEGGDPPGGPPPPPPPL